MAWKNKRKDIIKASFSTPLPYDALMILSFAFTILQLPDPHAGLLLGLQRHRGFGCPILLSRRVTR